MLGGAAEIALVAGAVAEQATTPFIEIEVVCADSAEHRRRVETRQADIAGHRLPRWAEVERLHYESWAANLTVDTGGRGIDEIAAEVIAALDSRS